MSKHKQRIFAKFNNFYIKINGFIRKLNNQNNKNNKNNQNIMEPIIIQLGHYRSKYAGSGLDGQSAEIIKIISPSENPSIFISNDGKKYSEYELQNNWDYLATSLNEEGPKRLPKHLLDGIGEFNENENENLIEETTNFQFKNEEIPQTQFFHQVVELTDEQKFINTILQKVKKESVIPINIDLRLSYDFFKLKDTIELLSIDKNKIIEYLLMDNNFKNEILNQISNQIFKSFETNQQTLNEVHYKNNEIKEIIVETPIIETPIIETPIIQESIIESENDPRFLALQNKIQNMFKDGK